MLGSRHYDDMHNHDNSAASLVQKEMVGLQSDVCFNGRVYMTTGNFPG